MHPPRVLDRGHVDQHLAVGPCLIAEGPVHPLDGPPILGSSLLLSEFRRYKSTSQISLLIQFRDGIL